MLRGMRPWLIGGNLVCGLILALATGGCDGLPSKSGGSAILVDPPETLVAPVREASNGRPDSYAYYGLGVDPAKPAGESYDAKQREGRDTWIMWTAGNQKFFRLGTMLGGGLGASIEYLRLLDSRDRGTRFERLGLINEPNCAPATKPDQYGFWLDEWRGDPYKDAYPDTKIYGEPTGVVGMRKYPNPKFDAARWDPKTSPDAFFREPSKVEPPYLVGMSCAFCHMGFHPQRPPLDPSNPRWENLAANLGNQYLAEGRIFFGSGKVVYGDQNGGKGLLGDDFLHQLGETQPRGTSETSRLSYDFINNPNTINSIFNLESRPSFPESYNATAQERVRTILGGANPLPPIHHVLKDGSDSQGIPIASIRVYVNIGMAGDYWITRLWNPLEPEKPQQPFDMNVAASNEDWQATFARMPALEAYLATYRPMHLEDVPGAAEQWLVIPDSYAKSTDQGQLARWQVVEKGRDVFADTCARCHSSQPKPGAAMAGDPARVREFYRAQVRDPKFLVGNALTDDVRYSVAELKENAARAVATNATAGHIWDQFSSPEYKTLPASAPIELDDPTNPAKPRVWQPPGGGRGYYRTASLVNIWATAPFLHNNSVGKFPGDLGLPAAKWPTVEGRLAAFQDAVEKLLAIKARDGQGSIKRVTQDTYLYLRQGNIEAAAHSALDELALPIDLPTVRAYAEQVKRNLVGFPPPGDKPLPFRLLIPKGTPINLLANLHVDNAPRAIKPFLHYALARKLLNDLPILGVLGKAVLEKAERDAMSELLALSEYPDLIEDHGHDYGKDLDAESKAALIEYLKKL